MAKFLLHPKEKSVKILHKIFIILFSTRELVSNEVAKKTKFLVDFWRLAQGKTSKIAFLGCMSGF
jgi:hypothetical protein